jgi:1A family penicillin-binding protein
VKEVDAMAIWKDRLSKKRRYTRRRRNISIKRIKIKSRGDTRSRRIAKLSKIGFLGLLGFFVFVILLFPIFAFTLPSPEEIVRREGFSTKILDRNGQVLYDIFEDKKRSPVELEDIPDYLKQAVISIEDKNFYEHEGIDPFGMVRGLSRVFTRGYAQGGSTLTQQLVKLALLTPERTVTRKIKEFILTVQIERKYSKDEILQMYLNEVPFGGTVWGVETAAQTYFGKSVNDLDLIESAILAGIPQRPSVYSPYSSTPDAYVSRAEDVLRRMREDGYIDEEQQETAIEMLDDVEFQEQGASFKAPHFVQYVQKVLEERYGENIIELGGLTVTTTLDIDLQEEAQKVVSDEIEDIEYLDITNGAAVVMNPETGEILAMVGSKDFSDPDYDGQVNVTLSLRQPGSAIKPITYVTALKQGYTASTLLMDVPTEFPGGASNPPYKPVNYDGEYRGPIQVRYALGNSINVAAVKMLALTGIGNVLETAYDLGLTSLEPTRETLNRVGLSLTLGGGEVRLLELTTAYSAFMNQGYNVEPTAILKVIDSNEKVLEDVKPKKKKRVLSEEEAFLITDILSDNGARQMVFGTNSLLNIPGRQIAVKTGTTNDKRDNWTVGGNSQVVVGVWVGNNDNSPMKQVASGVTGASPIWRAILLEALSGKPNVTFSQPSRIVSAQVDSLSGYSAHDGFPERSEYYVRGTEPGEDVVHVKLKICKKDGKLATPSDIARNDYEEKEYFVIKVDDPTAGQNDPNKWQEGVDAWITGQGDDRYHPPNDYCGTGNPVNVEFVSPKDHDSDLPNKFNVRAKADSTEEIDELELILDGASLITFSKPPYSYDVDLVDGVHKIKARAKDKRGNESDREITVGVGVEWNYSPSPTPTQTPTPTNTPSPTPTP